MKLGTSDAVGFALLATATGTLVAECFSIQPHLDDAYISYRYARNLVAGLGLVYNPGEYVEGYTNLLWTLLVAAGLAVGLGAKQAAHVLGVAGGVATLAAAALYVRSGVAGTRAGWAAGLAPVLLVCAGALPRWSTSGMETLLFASLVTAALAAESRGRIGWATLYAVVATATRPEGGLAAVAVLTPSLLSSLRAGADAAQRRRVFLCAVGYALWLGLQTLFRLSYYGALLPNTFHAKAGSGSLEFGLLYLLTYLRAGAGLLLLPALLAALWEPRWRPGLGFVTAYLLYTVLVGGDAFGQRFVLPTLPVLVPLAVAGSVAAWQRGHLWRLAVLCLPAAAGRFLLGTLPPSWLLLLAALVLPFAIGSRWRRPLPVAAAAGAATLLLALWPAAEGGSQLGDLARRLAAPARNARLAAVRDKDRRFERGALRTLRVIQEREGEPRLVATGAIGAFGYHADFAVLDLFGLTDATIARSRPADGVRYEGWPGHNRSNADYVMARAPDYVIVGRGLAAQRVPAVRDLIAHPDFHERYVWDAKLRGYRRRDRDGAGSAPPPRGHAQSRRCGTAPERPLGRRECATYGAWLLPPS